jgi:hypothetical protein
MLATASHDGDVVTRRPGVEQMAVNTQVMLLMHATAAATNGAAVRCSDHSRISHTASRGYTWVEAVISVGSMTMASLLATSSRSRGSNVSRSASSTVTVPSCPAIG